MAGAIKGCTGREPTLVGKPSPLMIDYIVEKYKCERERICMVGDRLDTDILFGQVGRASRGHDCLGGTPCRFAAAAAAAAVSGHVVYPTGFQQQLQ